MRPNEQEGCALTGASVSVSVGFLTERSNIELSFRYQTARRKVSPRRCQPKSRCIDPSTRCGTGGSTATGPVRSEELSRFVKVEIDGSIGSVGWAAASGRGILWYITAAPFADQPRLERFDGLDSPGGQIHPAAAAVAESPHSRTNAASEQSGFDREDIDPGHIPGRIGPLEHRYGTVISDMCKNCNCQNHRPINLSNRSGLSI